jgi:glycerophosphoryl diester phosphodiesterase
VGHKGADLIAPGNTYASFDAALAAGVDMIEFDVLPSQPDDSRAARKGEAGRRARRTREDRRLLLAHDYEDAAGRDPPTLEEGLEHLASEAFAGVEIDVDLKLPGYELRVLDALRTSGMLHRALISSQYRSSLAVLRAAEPTVRLGWSVPKIRRDPFRSRTTTVAALAMAQAVRLILPDRAARAIRGRQCDAVMAHWRLVTPRLTRAIRDAGGELYVWTVDELPRLRALEALGVTGVITNDPRLFGALA